MITSDWHIHTSNSCDQAYMNVNDLAIYAEKKGIKNFGISDHLHTPFNLPDIAASRRDYLETQPSENFHFGIEVSCVSQWEINKIKNEEFDEEPIYGIRKGGPAGAGLAIGISTEDIEKFNIEYVIGGTHWPMYVNIERKKIIYDYHRQNMFLAEHPLVDIVAHPWWWHGHWQDNDGMYRGKPWFDDFSKIPDSMHDEFAAAVIENKTAIEINIEAMLLNDSYTKSFRYDYLNYLNYLQEQGVQLAIGSDCHTDYFDIDFLSSAKMLRSVGISTQNLWSLSVSD